MKTVKVALIGLGFMGTTHLGIYKSFEGVEVVAVADVDEDKLKGDFSKVQGNLNSGESSKMDFSAMKTYKDAFQMIKETDADIIDICVPTYLHAQYIVAAMKAGKHVFSEKPLCRNLDDLKTIMAAYKDFKGYYNTGMCVRAWPEYAHARDLLVSGKVGKVGMAHFRRFSQSVDGNSWENWYQDEARSGGAAMDLHMHDCDLVYYFFGRPKAVTSHALIGFTSRESIDQISTYYDFGDNRLITTDGGWASSKCTPFEMSFQIICEKATLKMDATGYHVYWTDGKVDTPFEVAPELPTGWHRELKYFTDCVRDGVTPDRYQTPESIFEAFQVEMAELDSARTGKTNVINYL